MDQQLTNAVVVVVMVMPSIEVKSRRNSGLEEQNRGGQACTVTCRMYVLVLSKVVAR